MKAYSSTDFSKVYMLGCPTYVKVSEYVQCKYYFSALEINMMLIVIESCDDVAYWLEQ